MILALESYVLRKEFGEKRAFEEIKKAGFDGVDYSFYWWKPEETMLGENYLELAAKTKEYLDQTGLVCNQAHAPFDLQYGEAFDCSNIHYLEIVRSMEYAAILGVKQIIVHAVSVPEGPESLEVLEYNYRLYKSLEKYCEKFQIQIGVENLTNTAFRTPEQLNKILKMLDSEWFVGCLDVGHAQLVKYWPEEYIAGLTPGILQALHIHDNLGQGDNHFIPQLGVLNWEKITLALAEAEYQGDFTLEVFGFLNRYHQEALLHALKLCEMVGRELIEMVERNRR